MSSENFSFDGLGFVRLSRHHKKLLKGEDGNWRRESEINQRKKSPEMVEKRGEKHKTEKFQRVLCGLVGAFQRGKSERFHGQSNSRARTLQCSETRNTSGLENFSTRM
jgi:hypothetical protein